MESIRTVLFDLDGTLADTAPDLKRAADHVLKDLGRRALTAEEAYRTAPLGMAAMLKASLGSGIGKFFQALLPEHSKQCPVIFLEFRPR